MIALGRKFHPTDDEKDLIKPAQDHLVHEKGFPRTISIRGNIIYLAVCYDGFGIRHRNLENPGVDIVFDLVHGFSPKGEGNSGEVYFAKNGFAGASKQWGCPVFVAAVFLIGQYLKGGPQGCVGPRETRVRLIGSIMRIP